MTSGLASNAVVLVTGAAAGFGTLISGALGADGHTVYATMRDVGGRDARRAADLRALPGDIRPLGLDLLSEASAQAVVDTIVDEQRRLDAIIHSAGQIVEGVSEAFTAGEIAALFDTNVLGAQRVNRAALPVLRRQERGLLVWIGSATTRGGHPPFLGPYVATKAAADLLAQTYAYELARFGIETTIVLSGAFTERLADASAPSDTATAGAYERYAELFEKLTRGLASPTPSQADADPVASEVARIVALPHGRRPFRVVVDSSQDGAETVTEVAERVRTQFAHRLGIADLLHPTSGGSRLLQAADRAADR